MAGTKESNQKTRRTRLLRHGACKAVCENCGRCKLAIRAYKERLADAGAKGGKAQVAKGLAVTGNQYRRRRSEAAA